MCIITKCANTLEKHLQVLIPCNLGRMHWVMASVDLTKGQIFLFNPFRQEVPFRHRNAQVACLRWLLPSMLCAVHFHRNRRRGDMTYAKRDGPFRMLFVSADRVPQQQIGYDSFKFYILSKSVLITFHSNCFFMC